MYGQNGTYRLVEGRNVRNYPVWRQDGGGNVLGLAGNGRWRFATSDADMISGNAWGVRSQPWQSKGHALMPHLVTARWLVRNQGACQAITVREGENRQRSRR